MQKTLKHITPVVLLFICSVKLLAQDLHFSQNQHMPLFVNPALTGKFSGKTRIAAIHRQQWNTVTVPFTSFGLSTDFTSFAGNKLLGSGVSVFHDYAGDSRFTQTKVDVAGSYSVPLNHSRRHSLSLGLQFGLERFSFDYSNLQFDAQYIPDLGYTESADSKEFFEVTSINNPTASTGALYIYTNRKMVFRAGMAVYNLVPSSFTFMHSENTRKRRYNYHIDSEFELPGQWIIQPRAFLGFHNTLTEKVFGTDVKKYLYDQYGILRTLKAGVFFRGDDAAYITLGYEYSTLSLGLAYDINISDLEKVSKNYGAIEFSIVYIVTSNVFKASKFKSCPSFL
jgi:type IX secretion system PorP/SprF family membrane protein